MCFGVARPGSWLDRVANTLEFKSELECAKGPLSKVLLKGQGPTTAVSL